MKIIYLSLLLLLACKYGKSHKSIWEIYVNNTKNSLKGSGMFSGGLDAESNIVGGDILVDPDEPNPRQAPAESTFSISKKPGSIIQANQMKAIPLFSWHLKIWAARSIPYKITSSSSKDRAVIVKSLATMQKNMGNCLTFRQCRNCNGWWLEFFYGQGCFSGIGRKYWRSGPTRISIGANCNYPDIVQHEVLHALGFPHEQSRLDRDNYVKINLKYVYPGMESNFRKSTIGDTFYFGTRYDYHSVMHYGATAFSTSPSKYNTIEKIGDRSYKLGSRSMTDTDIKELKKMYYCDKRPRNSWSGWSDWINTKCMCTSDEKFCSRSKVRICFGRKACIGKDQQYGTQSQSSHCTKQEAKKVETSRDGSWGRWSSYSECKSDCNCGWGYQTRRRKCDNPKPINGNPCSGWDRQTKLCRRKRCKGYTSMSKYDDNFDKKTKWEMTRFVRRKSKIAGVPSPSQDHTYEITKDRGGYFAVASGKNKNGLLKSPSLRKTTRRKCLMFYYYMEGKNIDKKNALSVYMKYRKAGKLSYINLPFNKKGHQGNYWKRAAINIPALKYSHQVVIEARFDKWRESAIGIDDIFVDSNACPTGLNVCRDTKKRSYCVRRGKDGYCNHSSSYRKRVMFLQCCATCQDKRYRYKRKGKATKINCNKSKSKSKSKKPKKSTKKKTVCTDKKKLCSFWSKKGECKKNPSYMLKSCCKSCRSVAQKGVRRKSRRS